jgi:hypothetical protein
VFDNDVIDDAATYARVKIDWLDATQQTMGNVGARRFTRPGLIVVEINAPGNAGINYTSQLAGYARTIFEAVRFGATGTEEGVTTFASHEEGWRSRTSPRHWVTQVLIPFEFVEVR